MMEQQVHKQEKEGAGKTESIRTAALEFTLVASQTHACGKIRHRTDRERSELKNTTPEWQVANLSKRVLAHGKARRLDLLQFIQRRLLLIYYTWLLGDTGGHITNISEPKILHLMVKANCILTQLRNDSFLKM